MSALGRAHCGMIGEVATETARRRLSGARECYAASLRESGLFPQGILVGTGPRPAGCGSRHPAARAPLLWIQGTTCPRRRPAWCRSGEVRFIINNGSSHLTTRAQLAVGGAGLGVPWSQQLSLKWPPSLLVPVQKQQAVALCLCGRGRRGQLSAAH